MTEFSFATQKDWYAWGALLTQLAFLIAAVWFARNVLKLMRAFQEQIGALLKLSITSSPTEQPTPSVIARRSLGESSPFWLPPSESQPAGIRVSTDREADSSVGVWHRFTLWLQAPMHTSKASPWRRFANWLQAPAGS